LVTQGAKGSRIYTGGKTVDIPVVPPTDVVDPTGCGDAYRAGLLYGISNDFDWETTGRLASLLGSIKIAQRGPQNHELTRESVAEQFREAYGTNLW
jgi:adenosine kinase